MTANLVFVDFWVITNKVLKHRDFIKTRVAYGYLYEGHENELEALAQALNGSEFEAAANFTRQVTARLVEVKELPSAYRYRLSRTHRYDRNLNS
jgi:hypothetical protein